MKSLRSGAEQIEVLAQVFTRCMRDHSFYEALSKAGRNGREVLISYGIHLSEEELEEIPKLMVEIRRLKVS